MNKQEAINELKKYKVGFGEVAAVRFDRIVSVINQIHVPQKVVVPKFVAEWIEEHKAQFSNLYTVYSWLGQQKNQVSEWVNSNIDIFARAWLDGYEIEQEKLYTVEIPNPNSGSLTVLEKFDDGTVVISQMDAFPTDWRNHTEYHLTESEIKQDFEWAWQWAKPVEVE